MNIIFVCKEELRLFTLFTWQPTKVPTAVVRIENVRAHLVRNNYSRNFSSIRSTPWLCAVFKALLSPCNNIFFVSCQNWCVARHFDCMNVAVLYISYPSMYVYDGSSRDIRFPTMWYVRPAKAQTSLRKRTD